MQAPDRAPRPLSQAPDPAGTAPQARTHPRTDYCRPRVLSNRRTFDRLEHLAGAALEHGDTEGALALVRTAAEWAWFHHGGRFASPALEDVLRRAARGLRPPGTRRRERTGRRRVLHVFTEAYDLGGHTQLARRWIDAEDRSRHSVVLTGPLPVPAHLREAVRGSGGQLHELPAGPVLARASRLLRLLAEQDVVVLHVHPHDVTAVVAVEALVELVAADHRPAVVLLDHADHAFWLGARAADVVANTRPSADLVCTGRRGVAADRCVRVPIPLAPAERSRTRAQARRALGLPEHAQVLLSIGSSYKYDADLDVHLTELVVPVLLEHPDAVLLAVGPQAGTPLWDEAASRAGGRVRPLGYLGDLRLLHEAADVYLDSYPCPSLTSLLESCSYGTPALGYAPLGTSVGPMSIVGDVAGGLMLTAQDPGEYRQLLSSLLADRAGAELLGARTAAAIERDHVGEHWRAAVERAYAAAAAVRDRRAPDEPLPEPSTPGPDAADDALVLLHERTAGSEDASAFLERVGGPALSCAVTGGTSRTAPPLTIVLAVADGLEQTVDALSQVVEHCLPALKRVQTVVVDNGTTDGTAVLLQALADDITVVRLDGADAATAWAAGLQAAEADLVLLLSHDVRFDEDLLTGMVDRLAAAGTGSAVSGVEQATGRAVTPALPGTLSSTCLLAARTDLVATASLEVVAHDRSRVRVER